MQKKKSLTELASMFEHAGDIIAIRLEYSDSADLGSDAVEGLQEDLRARLGAQFGSNVLLVPSSEGVLVVTEDVGSEQHAKVLKEVQSSVEEGFSEHFANDNIVIEQIGYAHADNTLKTISHDEFVTLESGVRVQTLLNIERAISCQSFDFKKIMNPGTIETVGYFVTLSTLPQSPPHQRGHIRDPYYEPSPYLAGVDVATMSGVVRHANEEIGKGNLFKYYLPFNFQSVVDQRYWAYYSNEINNIPQYLRKFIVAELVRIPPGTPEVRIVEAAMKMGILTEFVSVSVNDMWSSVNFSALNNVSEVTIYPIEVPKDASSASHVAHKIAELTFRARSMGMITKTRKSILDRLQSACGGAGKIEKKAKFDLFIL